MTRHWLARAVWLWLGVRVIASVMLALAGGDALHPELGRSLLIVVATVAACLAQTARHREWALLGNLGVTRVALAATFALAAVTGELLLALVWAAR